LKKEKKKEKKRSGCQLSSHPQPMKVAMRHPRPTLDPFNNSLVLIYFYFLFIFKNTT
jgi:hypothetical protein